MALVSANPVRRKRPVNNQSFDRLFDNFFGFDLPVLAGTVKTKKHPAVNILETENGFQLEFMVPGWEKSDFQIQVEKDVLTVAAAVEKEETQENGVTYRHREFGKNGFKRSFQIPETVNAEAIDAKYENGILTLNLPKLEEAKVNPVRTIDIG